MRPCSTPGCLPRRHSWRGRRPRLWTPPSRSAAAGTMKTWTRRSTITADSESALMHVLLVALLGLVPADDFYGSIDDVKLLKPEDKVDMPTVPPPPGAIVLFDGKSLEGWTKKDGTPAGWKLVDGGAMEVSKS